MSTKTHRSNAERLGRWLGGMWRAYARRESQAIYWLANHGVPAGAAVASFWVVKIGVLATLFYIAFWLALLMVFAVAAAWVARNSDFSGDTKAQTEWRYGPVGYGLYTSDGYRVDPHDPEDEQD